MPALNFQKQFEQGVENGIALREGRELPHPSVDPKTQTIRLPRKHPIKPGDTLYLYTDMRTKACRKLGEVRCKSVEPFSIRHFPDGYAVAVACRELGAEEAEAMAIADGFDEFFGMIDWFEDTHGLPFEGVLVKW